MNFNILFQIEELRTRIKSYKNLRLSKEKVRVIRLSEKPKNSSPRVECSEKSSLSSVFQELFVLLCSQMKCSDQSDAGNLIQVLFDV